MKTSKNLISNLLLFLLILNFISLTVPINQDTFFESNHIVAGFLRGLGLKKSDNKSYIMIPKLLNDSTNYLSENDPFPRGINFKQSQYAVPGWADTRWKFRKNITIDHTKVNGSLTNFPVLIDLYDSDLQKVTQTNGNDIMFANETGSILDHEIESYDRLYNSTHAHLIAWVETNLSGTQDTKICMYYGNPAALNQENPAGVWNSDYVGVWHLAEITGGTDAIKDSTSNNNDGTDCGDPTLGVISKIGTSISFDGIDDYLNIIDSLSLDITDEITIEAWVKDPAVVYYFNGYDSSEAWPYDPQNSVDGNELSRCHTDWINPSNNETHLFNSNTAPGIDFGTITKVEIRGRIDVYGSGKYYITPVFSAGNGSTRLFQNIYTDWTSWLDITSDPNAPNPWAWLDVKNLNVRVMASDPASHDNSLYKMEIRVTYQKTIINKGRDAYALTMAESGSPLYGYINNNEISTTVVTPTDWHLYVMTYNSLNQILYIDGEQVNSSSLTGSIQINANNLIIGSGFTGIIDEVRISNVAHTTEWIRTQFNNQNETISFFNVSSVVETSPVTNDWTQPGFKFRKIITIDSNKVNGSGSLVNFPIYINLSDNNLHDITKVQADGDDILFTDNLGTILAHEIEVFDQIGNGTHAQLAAWIKVPNLSAATDTNITMYYGNPVLSSQENPEGVWDTNYEVVHHLNEVPTGTVYDSTSNNIDVTSQGGMTTGDLVDGWIGKGIDFDGIDDGLQSSNSITINQFTMSLWFKQGTNTTYWRTFASVTTSRQFALKDQIINFWTDTEHAFGNSIAIGEWHYAVLTFDGSNYTCYLDGIQHGNNISDLLTEVTADIEIGYWKPSEPQSFDGILDEVRISNNAHYANWIATEYNNQYDPKTFYSVSSEENNANWWTDSSFSFRKDIVIDKGMVLADLNDFPVLISLYDTDLHDPAKVQNDGDDILFTNSSGYKLDYEIELFNQSFNSTHAQLIAWVKVPTLTSSQDTIVSMYYGNSEVNSQENPKNVWVSTFDQVWHLDETSGTHYDSAMDLDHGEIRGTVTQDIDGIIYGADEFNGLGTESYIQMTNSENLTSNSPFTVEAWFYLDALYPTWIGLVQKGQDVEPDWLGLWIDDSNRITFGWDWRSGGNLHGSNLSAGQWYHAVATFNGTHRELYLNGTLDVGPSAGSYSTIWENWTIGTDYNGNYFDGIIDEVRISNVARSAEWIFAEFNNQYNPSNFYLVGSEVSYDINPPVINDFGVDDPGTGTGGFWADVIDTGSGVANVTIRINSLDYDMSFNGSLWIYQLPSLTFGDNFTYQIINSSDNVGYYLTSSSIEKYYTFNYDNIAPLVVDWEYYSNIGENGTFKANVSDSWGEGIDTVIVNVTYHQNMNEDNLWAIMALNGSEYINDTIFMVSGPIDFVITVNDTAGNEFTSIEHSGFVSNHKPEATNLILSRNSSEILLPIYSNSTLYLNYTFYDLDNDSESGTEIRWYKNGIYQPAFDDIPQINSTYLIKGDIWNATVKPRDGMDFGVLQTSNQVTIQNTPPKLLNVVILPIVPISTSDLSVSYTFDDTDGDNENNTYREIQWYNSSTHIPAYDNSTTLPSSVTKKGEQWSYKIRCFDGMNYSVWYTSNSIVIENTPPTASNLTMTSSPQTGDNLVVSWDYDDVDGDPENSSAKIRWYKNNVLQPALNDSVTVLSGNTSKGEVWHYTVQVFDGQNYSVIYILSPGVQILNTAPTASDITITPSNPATNVSLTAEWNFSDVDGDTETSSWIIRWYKDGQYQATYDDQIVIPSSATSKGEYWNFTVQVHDGSDFSIQYNSIAIQIVNTRPEVSDITLTSNPTSSDDLVAGWTATDIDGDNPDNFLNVTIIRWYIWSSGWSLVPSLANTTVVQAGNLTKNDIWRFELEIFDGEEYSIVYISPNSTVLNSPPILIGTPTFNKTTNVSPSDDVNITYSYADTDGDNEIEANRIVYWYKNGQFFSSKTNNTILYNSDTSSGDFWQYIIQVYDGFNYSLGYTSILIIIGSGANTLPEAQNITLTASVNTNATTESLIVDYDYYDADDHLQVDYEILWYLNGTLQSELNNSLAIDSSLTSKHQVWNFTIRVYDGLNWSLQYYSNILEIQNSLPEVSSLLLTSNSTTSVNLTASWMFFDLDGDTEVDFKIKWYIDGFYNNSLDNLTIISFTNTKKGQIWNYSLQVFDGENYSILYNSTNTYILNTPPTATNITLTINPTTTDDLIVDWDFYDIDGDLENLNWRIRWYRYGVLNNSLNDLKILNSGNTSKGEYWYCTIEVFDGEDYSITYQSPSREILNTVPIIQGPVTINSSTPLRGEDLIVEYLYFDIDGDFEYGTIIRWYRNGILQPSLNDLKTVDGSNVIKNDKWIVMVSVSDGISFSSPTNSTEITVGNTAPQVDSLNILPSGKIYTTTTLVADFETFDADNDPILNFTIIWKIGSTPVPALENKTEVPANYTSKDQYWTYEIRVFDGTDWSDPKEPAFGVIIDNSKPTIANVVLTGGSNTTEDITLSYDFIDLDNDTEDIGKTIITWYNPIPIEGPSGKTLSHTFFVAGEFIFVSIIPHDGEDAGDPIITTVFPNGYIFVGNTAPSIVGIPFIYSSNGTAMYSAFLPLYINYTAQDIDNDSIDAYDIEIDENGLVVGAEYRWYRNNFLIIELTGPTVTPEYLVKGDKWIVSVRPRDRYGDFGDWVNSSEIEIGNSWPEIISFNWIPNYPTAQWNLSFTYEYFDYDSDIEWENKTLIQWFKNGTEIVGARNQSTLSYLQFSRGDTIYTIIRVFDGKNYSLSYQSSQITIQNALPQILSISISPSPVYTNDSLILSWLYSDPDNDPENNSWIIHWYRNGILRPEHSNKTNLESQYTKKGEIWGATLQVFDSYNHSIIYSSINILILNFPISILDASINDGSNQTFADIDLFIDPSKDIIIDDPDQDLLMDYIIFWYKNGIYQPQYDNQTNIPSSELSKGQTWFVIVRVYDGEIWSQNTTSSIIYIINKPPEVLNIEFIFDTNNSQVDPDIRDTVIEQFYVEDEDIILSYLFLDVDNDLNLTHIQWFKKAVNGSLYEEMDAFENKSVIPSIATSSGEEWYCKITPYDGYDTGAPFTSSLIIIESRPSISEPVILPDINTDGSYDISVEVINQRYPIQQVIFLMKINGSLIDSYYGLNEIANNWTLHFELSDYSLLNTEILVEVKAISKIINSDFEIFNTIFFTLEVIDKAPPRVLNAYFQKDDDLNPTELTFFVLAEENGLGINEVILYYCFVPFENGGTGSGFFQENLEWLTVSMTFESENASGVYIYSTTVEFIHNKQNMDIIYKIQTSDLDGNINPSAFDIRDYPQQMDQQRIYYQAPGLPSWVLLIIGFVIFLVFVGAVIYVKFIRKPELVGLDKELVLMRLEKLPENEIMESLDEHTIGIVISFFDQRHGPIPIIITPEILNDNFTKLVELSDRSFSGTGFSNDFKAEIPSNYDFVLDQGIRTSVMSFGFALERPDARGGQENLTLNILIHQDVFPLVQSFQKEVQRLVHKLHLKMDKEPSEKESIRKETFEIRKYVSAIILSYFYIYGTTELLEVEE